MPQQLTRFLRLALAAGILAGVTAISTSCQEVEQPSTTLTTQQWKELENQYIIGPDEPEPDPEYVVNAEYGNRIKFLGYDIDGPLEAGKEVTFTWYWKALKDMDKNWRIFVHFDSQNEDASRTQRRQNLGHHPLESQYEGFRTSRWRKNDIIKDVQKVTIRPDYPPGIATPYIGFYRDSKRLPITNKDEIHPPIQVTNDSRVRVHKHRVKAGADSSDKPSYSVTTISPGDSAQVDGKLDEDFWANLNTLQLKPMGHGSDLATEVRVGRSPDALWVGADLADTHIWSDKSDRDARLWEQEVFEMFVDPNGDSKNYLELQLSPKGTIFDANFKQRPGTGDLSSSERIDQAKKFNLETMDSAVSVDGTLNDDSDEDTGWTVELRIPFESIPGVDGPPAGDARWAANFYRFDRPDDDTTHAFAWSTAARGDFHQVDKFGTLAFQASDGASTKGDSEGTSESDNTDQSEKTDEDKDDNDKTGSNDNAGTDGEKSSVKEVEEEIPQLDPEALKRLKRVHGSN